MAADIFLGVKVLTKLVGAGVNVYRAAANHDDLEDSIKAIQSALDAGASAVATWEHAPPTRVQARHIALVVAAFGEAWTRHFAPRLAFDTDLERHREAAIRWAFTESPRLQDTGPKTELDRITQVLSGVLQTPYYRALWDAFTLPSIPDLHHTWAHPLIEVADAKDQRAFETSLRRAYAEALSSNPAAEVRAYLVELASDRRHIVLELMVRDLATWGSRHVFGNVATHARLPDMPLAEMYVEPWSALRTTHVHPALRPSGTNLEKRKVLTFVETLLEKTNVVVVTAHFGHGKSLSARMLAHKWASEYVDAAESNHGIPYFVKCSDDLSSAEAKLPKMVERALWRQVGLGHQLGLKDTDPAFRPPSESERAVFLIDGLDEVALTPVAVKQLFEHLRGQATKSHKIIVFSRPEVLPEDRLRELEIPVVELLPFSPRDEDGNQIREWIEKWNEHSAERPKLSFHEIEQRGLIELAQTPILLFMIAETWGNVGDNRGIVRQADLYEAFLTRMARGKHEADRDKHLPIAEAAEKLHRRLIDYGRIPADSTLDQAMLWALSRIAWESHCLEQREKPLTQRRIVELLDRELDIDDDGAHQALCDGVLLALQADFSPGGSRILFGHRSFREFLVARYWERCLWHILTKNSADWRRHENRLLGGRLLGREDRSLAFLLEILDLWEPAQRDLVSRWGEQTFNDERLSCLDDSADAGLVEDRRSYLREAALAIGSCVSGSNGITARSATTLRSLLAWFWAHGEQVIIKAPLFRSHGAKLSSVTLSNVNLRGADLRGADMREIRISESNLNDTCLHNAKLGSARLSSCDLERADISEADCQSADFYSVVFRRASFQRSSFTNTSFTECDISGVDFSGADLRAATLSERYIRDEAIIDNTTKILRLSEVLVGIASKQQNWISDILGVVDRVCQTEPDFYWFMQDPHSHISRSSPAEQDGRKRVRFHVRVATSDSDKLKDELAKLSCVLEIGIQQGGPPRSRRVGSISIDELLE